MVETGIQALIVAFGTVNLCLCVLAFLLSISGLLVGERGGIVGKASLCVGWMENTLHLTANLQGDLVQVTVMC